MTDPTISVKQQEALNSFKEWLSTRPLADLTYEAALDKWKNDKPEYIGVNIPQRFQSHFNTTKAIYSRVSNRPVAAETATAAAGVPKPPRTVKLGTTLYEFKEKHGKNVSNTIRKYCTTEKYTDIVKEIWKWLEANSKPFYDFIKGDSQLYEQFSDYFKSEVAKHCDTYRKIKNMMSDKKYGPTENITFEEFRTRFNPTLDKSFEQMWNDINVPDPSSSSGMSRGVGAVSSLDNLVYTAEAERESRMYEEERGRQRRESRAAFSRQVLQNVETNSQQRRSQAAAGVPAEQTPPRWVSAMNYVSSRASSCYNAVAPLWGGHVDQVYDQDVQRFAELMNPDNEEEGSDLTLSVMMNIAERLLSNHQSVREYDIDRVKRDEFITTYVFTRKEWDDRSEEQKRFLRNAIFAQVDYMQSIPMAFKDYTPPDKRSFMKISVIFLVRVIVVAMAGYFAYVTYFSTGTDIVVEASATSIETSRSVEARQVADIANMGASKTRKLLGKYASLDPAAASKFSNTKPEASSYWKQIIGFILNHIVYTLGFTGFGLIGSIWKYWIPIQTLLGRTGNQSKEIHATLKRDMSRVQPAGDVRIEKDKKRPRSKMSGKGNISGRRPYDNGPIEGVSGGMGGTSSVKEGELSDMDENDDDDEESEGDEQPGRRRKRQKRSAAYKLIQQVPEFHHLTIRDMGMILYWTGDPHRCAKVLENLHTFKGSCIPDCVVWLRAMFGWIGMRKCYTTLSSALKSREQSSTIYTIQGPRGVVQKHMVWKWDKIENTVTRFKISDQTFKDPSRLK